MNRNTRFCKKVLMLLIGFGLMQSAIAVENKSKEDIITIVQQDDMVITGKVLSDTQDPLPGVNVFIRALNLGNSTNWDGYFTLDQVPIGTHTVEISYLGFDTFTKIIEVTGSTNMINLGDIVLTPSTNELGEVLVTGSAEGQQRAYNLQRTSDNIKTVVSADLVNRFPDINVGEAMQRVSGVTIDRDNGEGAVVKIRGTPQNFTTVSINGEQIPSTDESGGRSESLDLISADQLAAMEISKAITPDMDGDAVGGAINLITPTARSSKARFKGSIGGGYNDLFERGSQIYKLKYDQRFAEDKFGVLFGASYYNTVNGEERYEASYRNRRIGDSDDPNSFTADVIDDFRLRPKENERQRIGVNITFDYKFSPTSKIVLKGIYNDLRDESLRRRTRFRPRNNYQDPSNPNLAGSIDNGDVRVRRDINDRVIDRENITLNFEGEHGLGNFGKIDYGFNYTRSERILRSDRFVFRKSGLILDVNRDNRDFPVFSSPDFDFENYEEYEFNSFQQDKPILNRGDNLVTRLNFTVPFTLGNNFGEIKIGGKYRDLDNLRRRNTVEYSGFNGPYNLSQVLDGNSGSILDGNYEMGQFPDPNRALQHFLDNIDAYELDENATKLNSDSFFYDASENVTATFIQGKIDFNKLRVLAGVRYEKTDVTYDAFRLDVPANDNEQITSNLIQGNNDYDFFLPMLHLKYKINDQSNIRGAITRSYARPNLQDLVPAENINFADQELRTGNPDLKPSDVLNLDLLYENYFESVGVISGGIFYKDISDFIFLDVTDVDAGEFAGFRRFSPVNGDEATLFGAEINFSRQLDFLPGVLSGLGIYANYTHVQSESSFSFINDDTGETETRDDVDFAGQADNVWNVALSYDLGKFSSRVSLNYNSSALFAPSTDPNLDRFIDERYQLDANASYKLNDHLTIFAEFVNLLDDPTVIYQSNRSQVIDYEIYGWSSRFGLNFNF
ncbi:TonB-dependent receptor [Aquimarina algicola]|uniref:TonB-dependent receptor n=1 Tax=Aquimarina algicola TaxID=2589995 RepID=A0A504IS88_9FLAO|nr:TonB-dependent receptor [Aquimarina algicola]TPN81206.1 TonB-dependent receptor [Aquimarina algicola]